MMQIGVALMVSASLALPAHAEMTDAELYRLEACYRDENWDCAFDGLVKHYSTELMQPSCLLNKHDACGDQMWSIFNIGIAASVEADAVRRRYISERALEILDPMTEGLIAADGEVYFSALRFDACKRLNDAACANDSAKMLKLAKEKRDKSWLLPWFEGALKSSGHSYPINLNDVMAEVSQMEEQE
jgi:hypothetical protein